MWSICVRRSVATLFLLALFISKDICVFSEWTSSSDKQYGGHPPIRQYPHAFLVSLQHKPLSCIPPDIRYDFCNGTKKNKKRGSRGGIKNRLRRRGGKLPMPSITLTNARSLNNKMDELCALIKHDSDYRMSNLVCVTETWFNAKEYFIVHIKQHGN